MIEPEMAAGHEKQEGSPSKKGSPPSKSDDDLEKDPLQQDGMPLPSPTSDYAKAPSPKFENEEAPSSKSAKYEAPLPKSDDSNFTGSPPPETSSKPPQSTPPPSSLLSPERSPPKKSPPPPPPTPPAPPLSSPPSSPSSSSPPPPLTSPPSSPSSPPPPPPLTPPPSSLSSPPPPPPPTPSPPPSSPSSDDHDGQSSIVRSKKSPPPSKAPAPSESPSSTTSSSKSPPPPKSHNHPPPPTLDLPSPPHSPYHSVSPPARPKGSPHGSSPSKSEGGNGDVGMYVGIALGAVVVVAFVAICILIAVIRKKKRAAVHDVPYTPRPREAGVDGHYYGQHALLDGNYKNGSPRVGTVQPLGTPEAVTPKSGQIAFSYESIMEITNGFSSQNVIGEGGFGCVYRGWLIDGKAIAVKKLKADSGQGDREFRAEVETISRVHHRHLVSLVGYCIAEQQKILIYEFLPNGNLEQHLHGKGRPVLDWTKRVKIAIGAARGLAYLHEDCNPKIIHRDIKSANILLDDAYEAQVADFGLARLSDDANTHVSTRVMGTFGYLAPEYATSGKLTDKSDVFSFGVVLLELVTGRKPVDQTQPLGEESLVEWARPHLIHAVVTGDFSKLIDPRLENHYVEREVLRMIEAAAACIRHSAPKRPRMFQVVRALDSDGEIDLSNGMKYGQSTVYASGQYDEDILRFKMMNGSMSFGSSEFDMYSRDYGSREFSGFQHSRDESRSPKHGRSSSLMDH